MLCLAIASFAVAAAAVPFALSAVADSDAMRALPTAAVVVAVTSASAAPLMLASAVSTVVVFTDLHRSVPWDAAALQTPTALHRLLAGPSYLTELPLDDEEEEDDDADGGAVAVL